MKLLKRVERIIKDIEIPDDVRVSARVPFEILNQVKVTFSVRTCDASREGDPGRRSPVILLPGDTYDQNFHFDFWSALTDDEIITRMLQCMIFIRHHEAQEWFRYQGKLWRDPHVNGNPVAGMISYRPIGDDHLRTPSNFQ